MQGEVTHFIFCLAVENVKRPSIKLISNGLARLFVPSAILWWQVNEVHGGGRNNCCCWFLGLKAHAVLPPPIQSVTQPLSSHSLSTDKST